jgi:hypothetical protein
MTMNAAFQAAFRMFFRTTSLEVEYLTQMFPLCWVFGKMDKKIPNFGFHQNSG